MSHPTLIAVNEDTSLHPNAKFLFCLLYGYATNGTAVLEEAKIAALMEIGESRLRAYRAQINGSGFGRVKMSDGYLTFILASKWQ